MKKKFTVKETLVITKVVEIEVEDSDSQQSLYDKATQEAYQSTIVESQDQHGWVGEETIKVEVI